MRQRAMRAVKWMATALAAALIAGTAEGVRIKDLGRVYGPMENPLVGAGLVVGLPGTGDDAKFTPAIRALCNMLTNLDAGSLPIEVRGTKNVALVMVSATLPAYNSKGDKLDVQVSSIGNAKSLAGGQLLICPLLGPRMKATQPNGGISGQASGGTDDLAVSQGTGQSRSLKVYAIASGYVKVDGANPTQGTVVRGAEVQSAVPAELTPGNKVTFKLLPQNADASVATLIVQAIHQDMNIDTTRGDLPVAYAADPATIEVKLNDSQAANPVAFISRLEKLWVPGLDYALEARVVIDEKKGTFFAMNGNVEISPVVVGQGNIQITIKPAQGEEATTLDDLVQALKDLNATPADVAGIVKSLEALGAIHAKVIRL